MNQIKYILMVKNASIVLPINYPISTFKNIEYFIHFVLAHYVSVLRLSIA